MSSRREPVNLVWWFLAGGILLGILVDNPFHWNQELLREREAMLSGNTHGRADLSGNQPRYPDFPLIDSNLFLSLTDRSRHVESSVRASDFHQAQPGRRDDGR